MSGVGGNLCLPDARRRRSLRRVMHIHRGVASLLLAVITAVAACGGGEAKEQGKGTGQGAAKAGDRPAFTTTGKAADTAKLIAVVDETRTVLDPAALMELAGEAAGGMYDGEMTSNGLALRNVPTPSILATLGLASGDVVVSVAGVTLRDRASLQEGWVTLRDAGKATVKIDRAGQPVERRVILLSSLDRSASITPRAPMIAPEVEQVARALAGGVARIGADTYDLDRRVVATLTEHPYLIEMTTTTGRESLELDPGSPLEALALTRWDSIVAIGGQAVRYRDDVGRALQAVAGADLTIDVLRAGDPVTLRYRLTDGKVDGARLDAALAELKVLEDEAARRAAMRPPEPTADDPDLTATLDAAVRKIDDEHFEIDRDAIDKILANPLSASKGARVTPSIKDGKANGIKLYAIRPNSIYARLGLANGDTIHAINGNAIDSMDRGLEVYSKIRDAKKLTVDITRRGKPVTLYYSIR